MKEKIKIGIETFIIAFLMGAGLVTGMLVVSKIAELF